MEAAAKVAGVTLVEFVVLKYIGTGTAAALAALFFCTRTVDTNISLP